MNCSHLRVGDEAAIRSHRWQDRPTYRLARIARVCQTGVMTECGRHFGLKSGREEAHLYEPDHDLVELTDEIRRVAEPAAPAVPRKPGHRKRWGVDA